MVEVEEENDMEEIDQVKALSKFKAPQMSDDSDDDGQLASQDKEPPRGYDDYDDEEELVPVKPGKKFLFGAVDDGNY